jgi:hypothetical protein
MGFNTTNYTLNAIVLHQLSWSVTCMCCKEIIRAMSHKQGSTEQYHNEMDLNNCLFCGFSYQFKSYKAKEFNEKQCHLSIILSMEVQAQKHWATETINISHSTHLLPFVYTNVKVIPDTMIILLFCTCV